LQQVVVIRSPDLIKRAKKPESAEAAEEIVKVLWLMLGCSVQSDNREHFPFVIRDTMSIPDQFHIYGENSTDNFRRRGRNPISSIRVINGL
ncbi:unnamed protein product, partial [Porites lobata]